MASDLPPQNGSRPSQSVLQRFWTLSGLGALTYVILLVFYANPTLSEPRLNRELLVWPVTLVLIYLYWAGFRLVATGMVPKKWVLLSATVMAVIATLTPPFHSTDVFGYINRGWQQVEYGMNPYVYTVDHIPQWENDPMVTDHWVNNPSPYGFLYLLIAKGLTALGGGDKAATLMVFKLGNLLIHAMTAVLVWLGVSRLQRSESGGESDGSRPELALYLYLLNPLVLVHSLINAHNDIIMGFFVTLAAYFALAGAWLWILPALMAATLIKYGALVILPLALLFLFKQKAWQALIGGTILTLGVFGVTGIPFLPEWQNFHLKEISRNAFVSHGSFHSMIYSAFKTLTTEVITAWYPYRETVRGILKNGLLAIYAIFYGWLALRRFRQMQYPAQQWVGDALLVMAVLICLISLKFYPWYLGMFFPVALFLREGNWLRQFIIVLSGAQLFAITFIGQAHLLNFIVMTGIPLGWLYWRMKRQDDPSPGTKGTIG